MYRIYFFYNNLPLILWLNEEKNMLAVRVDGCSHKSISHTKMYRRLHSCAYFSDVEAFEKYMEQMLAETIAYQSCTVKKVRGYKQKTGFVSGTMEDAIGGCKNIRQYYYNLKDQLNYK